MVKLGSQAVSVLATHRPNKVTDENASIFFRRMIG